MYFVSQSGYFVAAAAAAAAAAALVAPLLLREGGLASLPLSLCLHMYSSPSQAKRLLIY